MRVNSLRRVEEHLKNNRKKSFSRTKIRDVLRLDYNSLLKLLAYLISDGKVKKVVRKVEVVEYQWK